MTDPSEHIGPLPERLTLADGRTQLRAPQTSDASRVAEFLGNIAVSGNLARVPHPYGIDDARQWLNDGCNADGRTHLAIARQSEGLIGMVGFETNDGDVEIGYWLGQPYWGRGLMTMALTRALEWHFRRSRCDRVVSGVFHFNMASLAVQQKLGFVETGRSVTHCLARGEDIEHIDTELTRDSFEASLEMLAITRERRAS